MAQALEKLPADRFDTGKAFAAALHDPAYRHASGAAPQGAADRVTDWRAGAAFPLAGVTVLLLVAAVWGWSRPTAEPARIGRFEIALDGSPSGGVAVSPDGQTIIYQGRDGVLMVRERGNLEARRVAGAPMGWSPFFSPDGASIGYLTGFPGSMVTVGVGGGATRVLVADSTSRVRRHVGYGRLDLLHGARWLVDARFRGRRHTAAPGEPGHHLGSTAAHVARFAAG